jgi:hypothetical protein
MSYKGAKWSKTQYYRRLKPKRKDTPAEQACGSPALLEATARPETRRCAAQTTGPLTRFSLRCSAAPRGIYGANFSYDQFENRSRLIC